MWNSRARVNPDGPISIPPPSERLWHRSAGFPARSEIRLGQGLGMEKHAAFIWTLLRAGKPALRRQCRDALNPDSAVQKVLAFLGLPCHVGGVNFLGRIHWALAALFFFPLLSQAGDPHPVFKAGAAKREITPKEPVPMWGYGARHAALSTGTLDPLNASAVVIQAGEKKLAIVGLDLGRSPAEKTIQNIRARIKDKAGIEYSFIAGSHRSEE